MKRSYVIVCLGVLVRILAASPDDARAGVNLNITIGVPPAFVAPAAPVVVPIPGTYVYFAPDIGVDILFYHGAWYRPYEGRWYTGRSYNGPWAYVAPGHVPRPLLALPHDYRRHGGGERIPYGQLKGNWARWERDKHWDKHDNRGGGDRRGYEDRGRGHEGRDNGHGRDDRGPGGPGGWQGGR